MKISDKGLKEKIDITLNKILNREQFLSTEQLEEPTGFKVRFWEARRISGDGPPYIYISKRAVRYKWGDVVDWMESKKIRHTAEI